MKNQRSYADPRSQRSGYAAAADGKGKSMRAAEHEKRKDRSLSPFSGSAGMNIDDVVTPGTWSGEKKTKNQRDGDLDRIDEQPDKRAHAIDDEQDWLESIDEYKWDDDHLQLKTSECVDHLYDNQRHPPSTYDQMDGNQYTELMSRLAMYRIRAHKGDKLKDMDIDKLSEKDLSPDLEKEGYYEWCELKFGWFFDPDSFKYSGFDDYQRLMIRTSEVEYNESTSMLASITRCKLEGDKQYLKFWNKLSSEIEWYQKAQRVAVDVKEKLDRVAYYRTVKISKEYPDIHATLIFSALDDYRLSVCYDNDVEDNVSLYFELWKRVAKEKMDLLEAMEKLLAEGKVPFSCSVFLKYELSKGVGPVTANYKTYIAGIDGKLDESIAFLSIKKANEEMMKRMGGRPKTYCDYAEEKLKIAEEIGVIAYLNKQKVRYPSEE